MKIIIGIVAIVVLVGGYYIFMQSPAPADTDNSAEFTDENEMAGMEGMENENTAATGEVREFTVEGSPFEFSMDTIEVNEGDTVRITFRNVQGVHDWVVDEFNARTEVLQQGEEETIEFVANQTGEFEYYCSVGNHREMGMVGTLIVN